VVLQSHRLRRQILDDLDTLEGAWPAKVLTMQRNWIGRSYGAEVKFEIEGRKTPIEVYTTRPDTIWRDLHGGCS
jgi:leucyl-tRNA synthetase